MITAFALVPIAMAVGASIDLADTHRQKEKLQSATDAAALAAARVLMQIGTKAEAEAAARNYLAANTKALGAPPIITKLNVDVVAGTVVLHTKTLDKVAFGGFLGREVVPLTVVTEAKGAGQTMEVAMVLDNSGSMNQGSRIEDLRKASAKFLEVLNADAVVKQRTSIAVVPFSSAVNVGPSHASASWIDKGSAPIHKENLIPYGDTFAPKTRQEVYTVLKSGWKWKGCVETREKAGDLDLDIVDVPRDDDGTELAAGDARLLFTPMFAPDEPDYWYSGHSTYPGNLHLSALNVSNFPIYYNSYIEDDGIDVKLGTVKLENCTNEGHVYDGLHRWKCKRTICPTASACTDSSEFRMLAPSSPNPNHATKDFFDGQCKPPAGTTGLALRRWKQVNTCKYRSGGKAPPKVAHVNPFVGEGPNYMCHSEPILPLTKLSSGLSTLNAKVTTLPAQGGTNILEGMMWGWRALSSAAPFTEGRPLGTPNNRKILVVMTDGQNTLYGFKEPSETIANAMNKTWYSSFGYGVTARLAAVTKHYAGEHKDLMQVLDNRMALACENAKDEGLQIYTIILTSEDEDEDVDWTAAKKLMRECATSPDQAFAPNDSDELVTVFEKIAKSIRKIHLSH